MLKKVLSSALALCLVFGTAAVLPEGAVSIGSDIVASAAETYGDYEYIIDDDGAVISKYLGSDTNVKIPDTLRGCKVVGIGWAAFSYKNNDNPICNKIVSVDIPASVTRIEDQAFYRCDNLTYVNLRNSNVNISQEAFDGTPFMDDLVKDTDVVIFNKILIKVKNKTGDFTVPDDVVSVVGGVFDSTCDITSITVPSSVRILSDYAFRNYYSCENLKTITINNGVTHIGNNCFLKCVSIEKIVLPNTLSEVGYSVFNKLENLKSLSIPEGIDVYLSIIGCGITELTIPADVSASVSDCKNLQSITYKGDDVTAGTFKGCDNLKTIRFSGNNPSISGYESPLNKSVKIYAHAGSNAIKYAKENGNPYEAADYIKANAWSNEKPIGVVYYSEKTDITVPEKYDGNTIEEVTVYDDNIKTVTMPKNIKRFYIYKTNYQKVPADELTIYCYSNSEALEYAKENNYKYVILDPHTHSHTSKVTTAATCTKDGVKTYTCSCGDSYTETIKATGHKYTEKVVAPTYDTEGYTLHTCSVCGDSYKDNIKPKLTRTSIAKASVSGLKNKTYTGKVITQTPVVKLGNKTLKSGTDYTVSYKNNKAVGTATVTVTGKGAYTGTVKATFKICPKKTTLKTVKSPKTKQLKATYTKVAGVTGYQITYSTSSKFTKATTKSVNASGVSKTISKLTKGKTYYVKVRTYKTVGKTKYYSGYSAVKKVKVK